MTDAEEAPVRTVMAKAKEVYVTILINERNVVTRQLKVYD